MTVHRSVFPERLFEFLFNAEFINKHAAQVIGMPHIPSQDEEEWLGYDVQFSLNNGAGVIEALALQHKVSRKVDGPGSGANKIYRATAGNPYFAFPVDPFQFNTIEALASENLPGIEFYFCAPLFVDQPCLDARYAAKDLDGYSVYIDVKGIGRLDESIHHSIVYTPAGNQGWVFSDEPRELIVRRVAQANERAREARDVLRLEQVADIYFRAFEIVSSGYFRRVDSIVRQQFRDDVSQVRAMAEVSQRLRAEAPVRENFENVGQCWLAISRLFAKYISATTIVERPTP